MSHHHLHHHLVLAHLHWTVHSMVNVSIHNASVTLPGQVQQTARLSHFLQLLLFVGFLPLDIMKQLGVVVLHWVVMVNIICLRLK